MTGKIYIPRLKNREVAANTHFCWNLSDHPEMFSSSGYKQAVSTYQPTSPKVLAHDSQLCQGLVFSADGTIRYFMLIRLYVDIVQVWYDDICRIDFRFMRCLLCKGKNINHTYNTYIYIFTHHIHIV